MHAHECKAISLALQCDKQSDFRHHSVIEIRGEGAAGRGGGVCEMHDTWNMQTSRLVA